MTWIDTEFPAATGKHTVTSDPTRRYNCIAFAAGETRRWWSYKVGYKWPGERSPRISALVGVFTGLGFKKSAATDTALELGVEKVALYSQRGMWTHAARQLPSGRWTSKLGPDEDIEHDTLGCLCGKSYGRIHCIMRRPIPQA